MGESRVDGALNVVEISGVAWALTVHKAAAAIGPGSETGFPSFEESLQAEAFPALDAGMAEAAEAELRRAGIVDGNGAINRQWVLAAWIAASAPVRAGAVVQSGDLSLHTELGLAGGRGVGVTYARRIRPGETGVDVAEVRNAVEISFFAENDAWAAIKRHLPEFPDVPAPSELSEAPGTAHHGSVAVAYTIHLEVTAHPVKSPAAGPPAAPAAVLASRDVWVLADRLYTVSTGPSGEGPALSPVSPNSISQGLAWRLLGAREYLASVAERAD